MAGIYHNAELGVISLSSDGESWITIADKNAGATYVYTYGGSLNEAYTGKLYQRGNNYGFSQSTPSSRIAGTINGSLYGPGEYSSSEYYYYPNQGYISPQNADMWGDITNTNIARRGPCPEGFHIPTYDELKGLIDGGIIMGARTMSDKENISKYLKLGLAYRHIYGYNGTINSGNQLNLWTSTARGSTYWDIRISNSVAAASRESSWDTYGYFIRPFKNEIEVPYADEGWTKLYGDDLPPRPVPLPKLKRIVKHNNYYYFGDAPVHASGISLNKSSITLSTAGQTEQLTATVTPDDAVDKRVLRSSSDTSVATVSSTGLVTCVTPGNATITATCVDNGIYTSCSVMAAKYVDFLLIAGGGGGGGAQGGGGGAGGMVYCSSAELSCSMYNVVIGTGGNGGNSSCQKGCKGGNSIFGETVAYGGGGGGSANNSNCLPASSGGSGGGAGWGYYQYGCSGTPGQGNSGGSAHQNCGAGGGGGAGGQGCSGGSGACGGIGLANNISGTSVYYSGGGAGYRPTTNSTGGCGGGGNSYSECNGENATYYGGGGGGGGYYNGGLNGGNGYQGIFILRYLTACGYNITGGTKYTCGDYTIHCFTSNGTLTVS